MDVVSRPKLMKILNSREITIASLARDCGISRQSLYAMFRGDSIYNVPFAKILNFLNLEPSQITEAHSSRQDALKSAPLKIQKTALRLREFCQDHGASLLLVGSQALGKGTMASDWDFAVYFWGNVFDRSLRLLKQRLEEEVFPYRVDIVNLNRAPEWFVQSVAEGAKLLEGKWPRELQRVA